MVVSRPVLMRTSKSGALTAVTCLAGAWCDEAVLTSSAVPAWRWEGPLDEQLLPEGQMGVNRGSSSLHSQHGGLLLQGPKEFKGARTLDLEEFSS